jgi:CBS domain-containing protein
VKCRELMRSDVHVCFAEETVARAARIMRNQEIGFLPIVDSLKRLIGVVTDRDLVTRVVADGMPASTKVGEIMTDTLLVTVGPNDDITIAESRMAREKKSRVVVVDEVSRFVLGVISLSDVSQSEAAVQGGRVLQQITRRESFGHQPT